MDYVLLDLHSYRITLALLRCVMIDHEVLQPSSFVAKQQTHRSEGIQEPERTQFAHKLPISKIDIRQNCLNWDWVKLEQGPWREQMFIVAAVEAT
jgi:hypothetical protein